jgi:hypothetical protein
MLTQILTTQKERDDLCQMLIDSSTDVAITKEDIAFLQEGNPVSVWQTEGALSPQESRMDALKREWKTKGNACQDVKTIVLLFQTAKSNPLLMSEMQNINEMCSLFPDNVDVLWGLGTDDNLGESIRLTVVCGE